MPFQPQGFSGVVPEVESTFRAGRVTVRPPEVLSWVSLSAPTGAMTGVGVLGAIFSLRNTGTNMLMVRRVGIGAVVTTAFTAAQKLDFGLIVARGFTASDTAGTALAVSGSNGKHRTSLATPSSLDCRISAAAALTVGTKTLDAVRIGLTGFWAGAIGATLPATPDNLFSHNTGDYPILLAANEGINILNDTAMGAGGVVTAYITVEVAEVSTY